MQIMVSLNTSWDSLFTYLTQPTKKKENCVIGTQSFPKLRYQILSILLVPTTADMSFTTTTGLIIHTHLVILIRWPALSVKQKFTVSYFYNITAVYMCNFYKKTLVHPLYRQMSKLLFRCLGQHREMKIYLIQRVGGFMIQYN